MNLGELAQEERRQFNRKLVLFFHALCAILPAGLYLSDLDLSHFRYWRRGAGVGSVILAAPPLLPYVISAVHSWKIVTYSRARVVAFLLILIAATAAVMCALTSVFGFAVDTTDLLWMFAIQAGVYFFSADFLFSEA